VTPYMLVVDFEVFCLLSGETYQLAKLGGVGGMLQPMPCDAVHVGKI
jgi:hypothetical protein